MLKMMNALLPFGFELTNHPSTSLSLYLSLLSSLYLSLSSSSSLYSLSHTLSLLLPLSLFHLSLISFSLSSLPLTFWLTLSLYSLSFFYHSNFFPLFLSLRYSQIQIESDWNRHLLEVKQNWCREFYEREKEERARQGYDKRQFVQVINFISNFIWKLWNSSCDKKVGSLFERNLFLFSWNFLLSFIFFCIGDLDWILMKLARCLYLCHFEPFLIFWVSSVIT